MSINSYSNIGKLGSHHLCFVYLITQFQCAYAHSSIRIFNSYPYRKCCLCVSYMQFLCVLTNLSYFHRKWRQPLPPFLLRSVRSFHICVILFHHRVTSVSLLGSLDLLNDCLEFANIGVHACVVKMNGFWQVPNVLCTPLQHHTK